MVRLMDALAFDTVPAARRLIALLRQRGWTGWTRLEQRDPPGARPRDTGPAPDSAPGTGADARHRAGRAVSPSGRGRRG
jgi:hypothetical protein